MRKLFCIAALCAALCFTTACGSESAAPNGGGTAAPGALSETGETQEEQWAEIACTAGFCGNPDSVESQFNGSILTEWYPDLTAGAYRLSFHVGSPDSDDAISAQFALE